MGIVNYLAKQSKKIEERVSKNIRKEYKGKKRLLKKPKVKVRAVSSSKLLKSLAHSSPVVKEVPERVYANDNRSLFFNNEMNNEIKRMRRF